MNTYSEQSSKSAFPDLAFSDILIVPQLSDVPSRSGVVTGTSLGKLHLALPVISANMRNITGPEMCVAMAAHGGIGILHRFMSVEDNVRQFKDALFYIRGEKTSEKTADLSELEDRQLPYSCGVSVGVKDGEKERFAKLWEAGARVFCVDIAHGHHRLMADMLKWMHLTLSGSGDHIFIAGNVGTSDGAKALIDWGADIIKVGVGPGSACLTRKNTGVGVAQFTALGMIRDTVGEFPIISDGGIVNTGDIPKALIYSDAVMVAHLIAGTVETPGKVYENEEGELYKVFGGSASGENKVANGGEAKFVEGAMKLVPFKGRVKFVLRKVKEQIQSACSWSGAHSLHSFQKKVIWRRISDGARKESKI